MNIEPQELAVVKTQVSEVQQAANSLSISSKEELDNAALALKQVATVEKYVVGRKEEITRPIMQSLAMIRDLFKPLETNLADAKKIIKAKMLAYTIEEEDRIQKEKDRITKRVEKGTMRADTAVEKLEAVGTPTKSNTREVKKVRIVDETAIPREYMVPNMTLITEAIIRNNQTVPGVETYIEKSIVVSRN